jgi:hypothetical protein
MSTTRHLFAALLLAALASPCSAAEDLITIPTRSGVTLSYLLDQDKAAAPKVVVISFIGGFGAIGLERRAQKGPVKFGPTANFLVRIRGQMTDADIADVIVDSPSDQLPDGMGDRFRLGQDHATDIRALIRDLKQRFPGAKIFLLGTSRGTISAAALGTSLGDVVQAVVLSSTVTNADRAGTGLSAFDFGSIKVPVLLVHHRKDGCRSSPYSGAERLAKRFPLVSVSGGDPPQSDACETASQHGYLGREAPTAQAIRNWMLGREFAREIQ